ncbi:MAG: alpha-glucosidase [Tessaracoccus sp.]|uniref:alpha-glucosidase n=1 Tax=Tessaracoccus sp. TaxID=1971211 RepID=UPI001EC0E3FF|nr:alpha-glucosidase [Tessaracoccus sp.]MBK7820766.1 alpha-glucosidase [Tessaracoccus sp.]
MRRRLRSSDRVRDLYATPAGRDIVDKVLLQAGLPRTLPRALGGLRLSTVDRAATRFLGPGIVDSLIELTNAEPDLPPTAEPVSTPWWRDAVFYQVYPRSFADSNGDGIGDLRGVVERLDYLADLGVDCVWLSPIFASPNQDMGYDISDYRDVMAEMGTLADLDDLVAGCHERGMRLILDLVVNHTSDQHEWFRRAVADPDGPYGRYYFFEKGTPDRPPNNWLSFFSGSAWRWLPEAERWVLHLFAEGQVDLRWDNPDVRREVADIVQFWLARGVDGFRLDVINYISKPEGLPDGHPFVGDLLEFTGVEQYFYGPHLVEYLQGLRRDGFTRAEPPASTVRRRLPDGSLGEQLTPDEVGLMVGETPGIGVQLGRMLSGVGRDALDLTFNFDVLDTLGKTRWDRYAYDPEYLKGFYRRYLDSIGPADWISVFLDNHDNPRMLSKIAAGREDDPRVRAAVGKLLATIQLTMRGTPFLFQGQELAAVDQRFTDVFQLRDVESINRYKALLITGRSLAEAWNEVLAGSRDHARVPLRWTSDGGFTTGVPWLVGTDDAVGFSAAEQIADPESVYAWHKALIALRRRHPALTRGDLTWVAPGRKNYFAYVRSLGDEAFLVECNTSDRPLRRPRTPHVAQTVLGTRSPGRMSPWEATVSRVAAG